MLESLQGNALSETSTKSIAALHKAVDKEQKALHEAVKTIRAEISDETVHL